MYLGIDVGTSGVKAVLLDEGDRVVAEANAPLEV
jgi:xylulokinase